MKLKNKVVSRPLLIKLWKEAFFYKKFRTEFFLTILLLALVLFILAQFLNYVEFRDGIILNDPLLNIINPVDLTWLIFFLLYSSILISLIMLFYYPQKLLLAFQAYTLIVIIRILMMSVVPLNPPSGMIPLLDPFVEYFGTGKTLTKDLFFSGHTAALFLLFLVAEAKYLKLFLLVSTVIVAASLLIQHVHYTIDVLAAFLISYLAFHITLWLRTKIGTDAAPLTAEKN